MLRSFKREARGRQFAVRVLLGVLLVANLVAAGILLFPPGGSAEDLERELASLQSQATTKRALLEKTRQLVAAVELGRSEGDQFLGTYFLTRRAAAEMLLTELGNAAAGSKIKEKERSVSYSYSSSTIYRVRALGSVCESRSSLIARFTD